MSWANTFKLPSGDSPNEETTKSAISAVPDKIQEKPPTAKQAETKRQPNMPKSASSKAAARNQDGGGKGTKRKQPEAQERPEKKQKTAVSEALSSIGPSLVTTDVPDALHGVQNPPKEAEEKTYKKRKDQGEKPGRGRAPKKPLFERAMPVCSFFLEGRCTKGTECAFRHEGTPAPVKRPICKFFKSNSCLKGDACPFSHDLKSVPCMFFHAKGFCRSAETCKYSHDPLSEEEKAQVIEEYNKLSETRNQQELQTSPVSEPQEDAPAPVDVLANLPSMSSIFGQQTAPSPPAPAAARTIAPPQATFGIAQPPVVAVAQPSGPESESEGDEEDFDDEDEFGLGFGAEEEEDHGVVLPASVLQAPPPPPPPPVSQPLLQPKLEPVQPTPPPQQQQPVNQAPPAFSFSFTSIFGS